MSSTAHALEVAAFAPATTPRIQGRQDLYRDAVQMGSSVSFIVYCGLAHNPLPSEKRGSCATGFNFLCSPPIVALG